MKDDPATHELSKMAVSPAAQGRGIGRLLLTHAIAEARRLGARSLFLGSNTRLANAVHLYETVGFRHIPKHLQQRRRLHGPHPLTTNTMGGR